MTDLRNQNWDSGAQVGATIHRRDLRRTQVNRRPSVAAPRGTESHIGRCPRRHQREDIDCQESRTAMDQTLENSIALVARTPATLNALLRDLPAAWTECNEGEKTWSAYDIVGHLIHGEKTDWIPRAK